jgi:hypothetical protein
MLARAEILSFQKGKHRHFGGCKATGDCVRNIPHLAGQRSLERVRHYLGPPKRPTAGSWIRTVPCGNE